LGGIICHIARAVVSFQHLGRSLAPRSALPLLITATALLVVAQLLRLGDGGGAAVTPQRPSLSSDPVGVVIARNRSCCW
jgi:hypothetical protein